MRVPDSLLEGEEVERHVEGIIDIRVFPDFAVNIAPRLGVDVKEN